MPPSPKRSPHDVDGATVIARTPLQLPRLLMRRTAAAAVLTLAAALLLGAHQASRDMVEEQDSAQALAQTLVGLQELRTVDDLLARQRLKELMVAAPFRHLQLRVTDAQGHPVVEATESRRGESTVIAAGAAVHRWFYPAAAPATQAFRWSLPRPDGTAWSATLQPSVEDERTEALSGLIEALLLLSACAAGMWLVIGLNLRHALRPVQALLDGIGGLERQDADALQKLPPMPVAELESIASALRHLARSLSETEERRRGLALQLLNLQEDERRRMARDLHDEMGQRLTALRLDLAWLARQLSRQELDMNPDGSAGEGLSTQVHAMSETCGQLQADIRDLLTRLRPFPTSAQGMQAGEGVTLSTLELTLKGLIDSWNAPASSTASETDVRAHITLEFDVPDPSAHVREDLALTLYRLTQEALTNVARHARARHATVRIAIPHPRPTRERQEPPPSSPPLTWSCEDDGQGLPEADQLIRGNGLAGMQERVWSMGGEWSLSSAHTQGGGLRLQAVFPALQSMSKQPDETVSGSQRHHSSEPPPDQSP